MIALDHIHTTYGEEHILKGLSLDMAKGELVACVGPSGSGKTTLLNVIAGLLTADAGRVEVAGACLNELMPTQRTAFRRKHLGFIFQCFNLLPYLTALENVEIPLYLTGMNKMEQYERAAELLDRVGLQGKETRLPSQLSMGEQQRVAIARALVKKPQVLLADEPTGNLDQDTGGRVMEHIRTFTEEGVSVVLVTHDPTTATFAHRILTISDGRLQS